MITRTLMEFHVLECSLGEVHDLLFINKFPYLYHSTSSFISVKLSVMISFRNAELQAFLSLAKRLF